MAENKNTLREGLNNVVIEGLLLEVRHQEWKSGEGLSIEIDIETGEGEVHTVNGMSKYKKADGSENGIAKGYQTIINDYCSVAKVGRENAHKVRVTQGRIGLNEYFGQDEKLKSFPQLASNFFNRVEASDEYKPRAEFEVEIVVQSVVDEVRNDEETGRAILKGFIPLYGGKVIPFEFKVAVEGADYVRDNYEKGQTVKVNGDIINFKEVTEIEEEVAFGKPQKKIKTKTIREYVVTGGVPAYDEENVNTYDPELIGKALAEREIYLEGLKKKKDEPKKEEKKGFDTKTTSKKPKINTDDLPF